MGKTITKFAAMVGVAALAVSASANSIYLNVGYSGTDVVGELLPGYIGGSGGQAADESADVNALIPMSLSSSYSGGGTTFVRSGNNFGTLPTAGTTGAVLASGVGSMTTSGNWVAITIGATGFNYLVGRWDGPNAGAEVWDIAGITDTTIYIPQFAAPNNSSDTNLVATTGQYGITSYSLFNPLSNPPTVAPEAASTVMLLGGALTGLALVRGKFSKK